MSLAYLFDSNIQFQDKSGNNNVNGFLRVYIDNTDDRAVTYKDFNGTLNQADIRLDNNGRAVVIVDDSKTYRLEVYGTTGVLLWTLYPISPKATGINDTLEALVAAVKSHTIAIEGLALGKKNKQQAKVISGSPTQTVKSISQNADGEITVEFDDIDFPYNTEISSPDGSIEVGTPVVDPVLKKETIPLSVANKGKVLIDENDSQQKYLEDAVKADENGLLRVRVDENEDSTPEHPDKVLVIDDSELRDEIYGNTQRIENIEEAIDELDIDSVPHAHLHSTLNHSAGDSSTTRTTVDIFACDGIPEGDCFEFEQTTTIDDTPYGYLWVEPGTYLINGSVTLQWVGNPRGTFVAKVGSVMGENFDFSQEQEILRNHTKIVTIPNRMKLSINITYDAGTPVMDLWIQSLQVVKLAGGMSQTNISHNDTLVGQGSVANPLGVDKAKVAQSTLAGNLAPAFDPTRTEDNKYIAHKDIVVKDGVLYVFVEDHYGLWNASHVKSIDQIALKTFVLNYCLLKACGSMMPFDDPTQLSVVITGSGTLNVATSGNHACVVDATAIRGKYIAVNPMPLTNGIIAFINNIPQKPSDGIVWSEGESNRHVVLTDSVGIFRVPDNCNYLYYVPFNNNVNSTPQVFVSKSNSDLLSTMNDMRQDLLSLGQEILKIGINASLSDVVLHQGTINEQTGGLDTSYNFNTIRVSNGGSAFNIYGSKTVNYVVSDGYKLVIFEFDGTNPITVKSGWLTGSGEYHVQLHKFIFFVIAKIDNAAITIAEARSNVSISIIDCISDLYGRISDIAPLMAYERTFNYVNPTELDVYINSNGGLISKPATGAFYAYVVDATAIRGKFITVYANSVNPGIIAFINNIPQKPSDGIVWSEGESNRHVIPVATSEVFKVPDDCNYLYYVPYNNNQDATPLIKVIGGTLGDVLNYLPESEIPVAPVGEGMYYGERITLNQKFSFIPWKTFASWENSQGGAVYGDYLVTAMACDEIASGQTNGHIYNLSTGLKVCDLSFSSTLDGVTYSLPHANCVCFGKDFYNSSSAFPLLYVSQVNGGSPTLWNASERGVLVYDLQSDGNGGYTPVLVQIIKPDLSTAEKITAIEAKIGKYTPNYVVDTDEGCIYVLGYPAASWFTHYSEGMPVAKLPLYPISEGSVITYDDSDVLDNYRMTMSFAIQQPLYLSGKIYIQGGTAGNYDKGIQVLDLEQKKRVSFVNTRYAHSGEPQFIGYYDDKLLWYDAGTTGKIYSILFD